jgi:hypothetical protein
MAMESATSKVSGPQPTDLPQRGWEDKVESFPKVFLKHEVFLHSATL